MAMLKDICSFLDTELKLDEIEDSSNNGLQFQGKSEVRKVAFAVDACLDVFEKAKDYDLIVVHHGLSWKDSLKYITGINYLRINFLVKNGISLYAAHLPLDMHEKYGNNVQLCRVLGLNNIKPFGKYHGSEIGYMGEKDTLIKDFAAEISQKLDTSCRVLGFGSEKLKSIGVVSGGGGEALNEAVEKGIDCFVTGELHHHHYHIAKEGKINVIAAGHYATETPGVKALMQAVKEKFGVDADFIDAPTGF